MTNYEDSEQKKGFSDKDILEMAKSNFKLLQESDDEIRKLALDDLNFRSGEQWPEEVRRDRDNDGRPCLTINRIPQFERQVTNDQKQNRPSIKVVPVDDNADLETAKVIQGLIRHIERNSNANLAYDNAFTCAVRSGFGFYRIITEYTNPFSFEQDILIKQIENQFSAGLDPLAKEIDGSDANWGFVFEDVPKDDFKVRYPDAELCSIDNWGAIGKQTEGWVSEVSVRVAEYFYREFKKVDIVLLSTGETLEKSKLSKELPFGVSILKERKAVIPVVKWIKINGYEIIEKADWPGMYIPIIPVYGDKLTIDGKRIYESLIRHAKDPQRMLNYWASTETETITLAPKAPYMVAEGQIPPKYEAIWKSANRKSHAYLPYSPLSLGGQLIGAPQRNVFEPAVGAITNARMQAADDLKATTGIYDSALGSQSRETSGVAIRGRQAQSQTSNFHFIDNLNMSIKHGARIILDLIPFIYDTSRVVRILGEDDQSKIVKLNQPFEEKGEVKLFDVNTGKYDVEMEIGPSYATKRQEAVASMVDLTRSYPQVAQLAGDLMVKNMDWPGASEIAARLKKALPPGIAEDSEDQKPIPPEVQAQMQQMGQMIDQLTEKLNEATNVINIKANELESKERIEFKKMENALILKQLELQGAAANQLFAAEIKSIQDRLSMLDINEPIEEDLKFEGSGNEYAEIPEEQIQQEQQQMQSMQQQPTGGF